MSLLLVLVLLFTVSESVLKSMVFSVLSVFIVLVNVWFITSGFTGVFPFSIVNRYSSGVGGCFLCRFRYSFMYCMLSCPVNVKYSEYFPFVISCRIIIRHGIGVFSSNRFSKSPIFSLDIVWGLSPDCVIRA